MIRRVYSYSSSSSSSTGKEKKGIKLTHYKHRCRHKPRATFKEGEKKGWRSAFPFLNAQLSIIKKKTNLNRHTFFFASPCDTCFSLANAQKYWGTINGEFQLLLTEPRCYSVFSFFIHSYIHCNLLQLFYSGDLPTHVPDDITAMCVLNTKISEAGYNLKPCQIGKRYRHQPTGLSNLGPSW